MTTHGLELIDALLAAHEGTSLGEMTVCRTRLHRGELLTHKISGPDLDLARNQIEGTPTSYQPCLVPVMALPSWNVPRWLKGRP